MKRKSLSVLLSLLMLLACIPLGAVSVSAEGVLDGLLYAIVDDEVTITGYTDDVLTDLVIPDTINGYPVTKIASRAFFENSKVESVSIGSEVVEIGEEAFRYCSNLTSVTMTDSVTTIGGWAFCNCWSLTSVTLSKSITFLDIGVFGCTSLESIVIPQGITSIGYEAFSFCSNLTTISIPNSVSRINMYAFDSCPSLKTVYYGGTEADWHNMEIIGGNEDLLNATWHYSDGTIYTPVPGLLFEIVDGEVTITGYTDKLPADLVIPDTIRGCPVTKIESAAFEDCDRLVSIVIPDSVVDLGLELTFYNCKNLTTVHFGKGITEIGWNAFFGCDKLRCVDIPEGVTDVYLGAFQACASIEYVSLPKSIKFIDATAFLCGSALVDVYYAGSEEDIARVGIDVGNDPLLNATWHYNSGVENGLLYEIVDDEVTITGYTDDVPADLVIPDTIEGYPVTKIGDGAFFDCGLTSVVIPNSVSTIGKHVFWYNSLGDLIIPDSVTTIGFSAFQFSGLESVIIGDGVTCIGDAVFSGCFSLRSVVIGDGVTTIMDNAFECCDSLVAVTLSKNVMYIENSAFVECVSLTDIYYAGTMEDEENITINNDYGHNDPLLNATWHYNSINPKDHYSADVQHSVMDTERGNGLAFKFELSASVGVKNKNKVDFINATINYLGQSCKLVGMGAVITNQEDATLDLGNVNGKTVIDISTVYLTDWEPDSCAFAARVINIPDYALERVVYARPYYIVEVDGEQIVVYGDIDSASCAEHM